MPSRDDNGWETGSSTMYGTVRRYTDFCIPPLNGFSRSPATPRGRVSDMSDGDSPMVNEGPTPSVSPHLAWACGVSNSVSVRAPSP